MDDLSVILTRLSVEYGTLPTLSEDVACILLT
jgi:hypothetical protein